jgi:lysophospholipase L1-like esterase
MNTVARLALVPLLPLLITQAHWARRRAPTLPEAEGPREGRIDGRGPALRLLLVGDSSAAGVGVATQDQALIGHLVRTLAQESRRAVQWRVIARSGASTPAALALVDAADATPADVAVVALGVNDIVEQLPLARVMRARGTLLRRLRERFGVVHTVFAPMPPVHQFPLLPDPLRSYAGHQARRLDARVARWAARHRAASHVPIDLQLTRDLMAADGYHPAEPVYRQCGEALARHIHVTVLAHGGAAALAARPHHRPAGR